MPKGQKGINKMKKNIFKKIVASLATVAMAAGLFAAMPAEEAKADVKEATDTEWLIKGSFTGSTWPDVQMSAKSSGVYEYTTEVAAGNHAFIIHSGSAEVKEKDYDKAGTNDFTFVTTEAKKVTITLKVSELGGAGDDGKGYYWGGTYYVPMDSVGVHVTFEAATKTAGQIVSANIKEVLKKEATIDNKYAYDEVLKSYEALDATEKAKVDAADAKALQDAVKKINELKAAEDAKYAGKITIYAKPPKWEKVSLYGWATDDNAEVFGNWPGNQKLTEMKKNAGWYSCTFNMTEAIGVIFNNDNNGEQSADWTKMKPGTYWVDFSQSTKNEKGHFIVEDKNISTTAPSGWQEEAAQEVTTQAPTTAKPAVDKGSVATKDDIAKIDKEAVVEGAPEGAKLDATEIAADSDAFKVVKEAAKTAFKNKAYVALDLKLLKGTEAVQPNGDVKVTIPVPSALAKAKKVAVYRVGDDNKLVSCGTADVANGKLTFTTNHFSTYVFADATPATNTGDAAPIVFMLAVAAVAASMVIASKKKTICE